MPKKKFICCVHMAKIHKMVCAKWVISCRTLKLNLCMTLCSTLHCTFPLNTSSFYFFFQVKEQNRMHNRRQSQSWNGIKCNFASSMSFCWSLILHLNFTCFMSTLKFYINEGLHSRHLFFSLQYILLTKPVKTPAATNCRKVFYASSGSTLFITLFQSLSAAVNW